MGMTLCFCDMQEQRKPSLLLRMRALHFTSSGLLTKSTRLSPLAWRGQEHFLYNSEWICLKEEIHIHLGCFEGE